MAECVSLGNKIITNKSPAATSQVGSVAVQQQSGDEKR